MPVTVFFVHEAVVVNKIPVASVVRRVDIYDLHPAPVSDVEVTQDVVVVAFD